MFKIKSYRREVGHFVTCEEGRAFICSEDKHVLPKMPLVKRLQNPLKTKRMTCKIMQNLMNSKYMGQPDPKKDNSKVSHDTFNRAFYTYFPQQGHT